MTTTALDLLGAGLCTASCLLAMDTVLEDCRCRCGGRWHGTVIWADVHEWSGPSVVDFPRAVSA
jgi:hypothetical protein